MSELWDAFVSNWPWISAGLVTLFGAYGIKVKKAVNDLKEVVREVKETQQVYKDAIADNNISTEEAERLGKELQEDIVRIQMAAQSVLALVPKKYQKHIPVEFST